MRVPTTLCSRSGQLAANSLWVALAAVVGACGGEERAAAARVTAPRRIVETLCVASGKLGVVN
jgi:hypothetical protein